MENNIARDEIEDTEVVFKFKIHPDDFEVVKKDLKEWWRSNNTGMVWISLEKEEKI